MKASEPGVTSCGDSGRGVSTTFNDRANSVRARLSRRSERELRAPMCINACFNSNTVRGAVTANYPFRTYCTLIFPLSNTTVMAGFRAGTYARCFTTTSGTNTDVNLQVSKDSVVIGRSASTAIKGRCTTLGTGKINCFCVLFERPIWVRHGV